MLPDSVIKKLFIYYFKAYSYYVMQGILKHIDLPRARITSVCLHISFS